MECNKDEAVRAKEIAEKKMRDNDFDGARRTALKAQQLYPDLENISQLLAVCNVHCSAENKILGSEKDWYKVLQIESFADEVTIKKQYRKLALVLHPDKNKFPGAEAAFKLIGEAHIVLSDSSKRALYDSKVGVALKSAQAKPPYKANTNPPARQPAARNNTANGFSSQFGGRSHHQATQHNTSAIKESFWTCCPFCRIKYQFYREVQNKILRCQKCSKPFVAYEIAAHGVPGSEQSQATFHRIPGSYQSHAASQHVPGSNQSQAAAQGVPPTFNQSQPSVSKQKDDPIQGIFGTSGLKTGGPMASGLGSQGNSSGGPVGPVSGTEMRSNAKVGLDNKTKDGEKEGAAVPKAEKLHKEADFRGKNRKRGRMPEPDSSESFDTSDSSVMDDLDVKETSSDPVDGPSIGVNVSDRVRRSHRQKHQVSYNENETDDDDFESPPKRSRKEDSSCGEGKPEAVVNGAAKFGEPTEQGRVSSPGVSGKANTKSGKNEAAGQSASAYSGLAAEFEVVDVSESDDDDSGVHSFNVPDPEFNDFDKTRGSFAVDQFWAIYGDADGMPRFYAQIRKVYSSPFGLRITWLEPNPDDEGEIDWAEGGLPVGCGKFKRGASQDETNVGVFSHQLVCEKGKQRGSFMVYPRKGEIWALFKDWDIRWSIDPDNHKHLKYEIVEVISNFMEGAGVEVAFLERLSGFVSLFQRRSQNRTDSILIPANEMLRFSHRIPFFIMSGNEKEGVPERSFELDPACLPANYNDVCNRYVCDTAPDENIRAEANFSNNELSKMNKPKLSESENTPKTPTESVRKDGIGEEGCKLRRSHRGQNIVEENRHTNARDSSAGTEASHQVIGKKFKSEFSASEADVFTCKAEKRMPREVQEPTLCKSNSMNHSLSPGRKVSEDLLHDFKEDRSEDKFKLDQIWALYDSDQKLPRSYGQIKKIEQSPFKVHVASLESMSPSENGRQPVCGTFKMRSGKPRAVEPSSFSHLLEAKLNRQSRVEIYPKAGEVWALYRNWNSAFTPSDLENCECMLVQIIDVSQGCTKVSPLVPISPKYKLVFRSPRKQRSGLDVIEVQKNEVGRFSHRIPAILLTAEDGAFLAGSWLVDAAALPKSLFGGK